MSAALSALREAVAEQLRQAGVNALAAMEPARAARWRQAAAAVSLSRVECAQGGFEDYLGTRREEAGEEREVYGRQAEITLGIEIFAPRDAGAGACQEAAERVMESLIRQGAAGLAALEIQAGETEFLERDGLYRQKVTCRCMAWLLAQAGEGERFVDFEVKGRMR